jgi:nitroreductase
MSTIQAEMLRPVAAADARSVTGDQDFVDDAPLDLIHVADNAHMKAPPPAQRDVYSAASASAIAQNVHFYCASAGLVSVVRGWFDRQALAWPQPKASRPAMSVPS